MKQDTVCKKWLEVLETGPFSKKCNESNKKLSRNRMRHSEMNLY